MRHCYCTTLTHAHTGSQTIFTYEWCCIKILRLQKKNNNKMSEKGRKIIIKSIVYGWISALSHIFFLLLLFCSFPAAFTVLHHQQKQQQKSWMTKKLCRSFHDVHVRVLFRYKQAAKEREKNPNIMQNIRGKNAVKINNVVLPKGLVGFIRQIFIDMHGWEKKSQRNENQQQELFWKKKWVK